MARRLLFLGALPLLILSGCWGEHQIGPSRKAFRAVDALYTAIGLRDPRLVEDCERRLKSLRESSELPENVAESLESMIADTRRGDWEPAQERLSRFMEGQHR
jgi:hypothetical protein